MRPIKSSAQQGQALVAGLLMLVVASVSLFWWFGTSQTIHMRQKLETASDAAAYSAAVHRARVLNYIAYSNRAIIAQEVAIAQAVTLASWSAYFSNLLQTGGTVLSAAYPPAAPFVQTAQSVADAARDMATQTAQIEIWARGSSGTGYKNLLALSQQAMLLSAGVMGMGAVAFEVAHANDNRFFAFALTDNHAFDRMVKLYSTDTEKERLRDMVLMSLDEFVKGPRSLDLRMLLLPSGCFGQTLNLSQWFQTLRKRGGTELSADMQRWEAADTASLHDWRRRGFIFRSCRESELLAMGWGGAEAADTELSQSLQGNPGGTLINGSASQMASSDVSNRSFNGYSGITEVHDLNYAALGTGTLPGSRVVVLAYAKGGDVRTANTLNVGVGRLRLQEAWARDRMWSMSAAEVVFQKPAALLGQVDELPSLYAPWWQARLSTPSAAEHTVAQGYVGL